jgi:hypothetical protein
MQPRNEDKKKELKIFMDVSDFRPTPLDGLINRSDLAIDSKILKRDFILFVLSFNVINFCIFLPLQINPLRIFPPSDYQFVLKLIQSSQRLYTAKDH